MTTSSSRGAADAGKRFAREFVPIIPRLSQRQDSVSEQLADLGRVAIRLGMYDAADWLNARRPTETPQTATRGDA